MITWTVEIWEEKIKVMKTNQDCGGGRGEKEYSKRQGSWARQMKRVKLGREDDDNAEHMKKTEYKEEEDKGRGGLKKQRIRRRQRRRRNMKIKM